MIALAEPATDAAVVIIYYRDATGQERATPALERTKRGAGWTTSVQTAPRRWFRTKFERLYELDAGYRMRYLGAVTRVVGVSGK